MTIKEEIQNIIYMKIGKDKVGITWNETKEATNEILKVFEKSIDSWAEWAKPTEPKDLPKELDPKYYKAFNNGFQEALRLIKNIDLKGNTK